MIKAVAGRPVEQFDTQVTLPEWQLEPDEESYFGQPDNGMFVDENGYPLAPGTYPGDTPADQQPRQGYPDAYPGGVSPPDGSGKAQPYTPPVTPPPPRHAQHWLVRGLGRTPQ